MISIALPIHAMDNGKFFLTRCLDSILSQSYEDFEVVITDNSDDDKLMKVVQTYGIDIRYSKNPRKGMAQNTNEAIRLSKGILIKILYMDDYFAHKNALQDIQDAFKKSSIGRWLITATDNNRNPFYTQDIPKGNNRLGSPSALTILNKDPLLFDEEMTWLLDADYYKRMYDLFGLPDILTKVNVNIGVGEHQMTNILSEGEKTLEARYMKLKYEKN